MYLRSLAILLFLLQVTPLKSQVSITGTVVDNEGQPIPFCHVMLFGAGEEPVFLKGAVGGEDGRFTVETGTGGSVFLEIQSLGFHSYRSKQLQMDTSLDLGTLLLQPAAEELQEALVTASRPPFQQQADRVVVHVQGSVTNMGNTALNILGKAPLIRINPSGNEIAMMGKQGVVILVNNKEVRLEGRDLISYLSNLPADAIENIELITSPPAGYDAQGSAGIININTLRAGEGFSGQLSANAAIGRRPKVGASSNLTYQAGKLYTFLNLSANLAYDYEKVRIHTASTTLETRSDLLSVRQPRTGLYTLETGLDYEVTERTTIGVNVSALLSDWIMDSRTATEQLSSGDSRSLETISYEENKLERSVFNLNVRHSLSENTKLTADFDRIDFSRENPTTYTANHSVSDSVSNFRSNASTPVSVHVGKVDLEHRISEEATFSAGLKASFSDFENRVVVANESGGIWENDPAFTDTYFLKERIYAAYSGLDYTFSPRWRAQAGLRFEQYILDLTSQGLGPISNREQGSLFPTFFLTYQPREGKEWSFSYANRIQRPGFLILAPYFYFFDSRTLFTGNPSVLPSRSHQVQLNYSLGGLIVNLQYATERMPVIDQQPGLDPEAGLFIVRPIQGESRNTLTLNLSRSFPITRWWQGQFNVMALGQRQKLDNYGLRFDKTTYNLEASTLQRWTIHPGWEAELSASYYSPYYFGVMRMQARSQLDLGIRKQFASGAALSLNLSDVLNTGSQWPSASDIDASGLHYRFNFDGEGPVFRLSFSQPFGNRQAKKRAARSTGAEELRERLD